MQIKTFRVTFAEIVGEDATELDFGPDDYLVVRPLFGLSRTELNAWTPRFNQIAELSEGGEITPAAQAAADKLTIDLIGATCIEWHLSDADGKPIEKPGTPAALNALPGAVATGLLTFLAGYRGGDVVNPTTRS